MAATANRAPLLLATLLVLVGAAIPSHLDSNAMVQMQVQKHDELNSESSSSVPLLEYWPEGSGCTGTGYTQVGTAPTPGTCYKYADEDPGMASSAAAAALYVATLSSYGMYYKYSFTSSTHANIAGACTDAACTTCYGSYPVNVGVCLDNPSGSGPMIRLPATAFGNSGFGSGSAVGDPHVTNVAGERFDIMRSGMHTLVEVPRDQRIPKKLLVKGQIERYGSACSSMWITQMSISGSQLNTEYEFFTRGDHLYRVGNFSTDNIDAFAAAVQPAELSIKLQNNAYRPNYGKYKIAEFTINAGPAKLFVVFVRRQGETHYDFHAKNLGSLSAKTDIGGLMGIDDHTWATSSDGDCVRGLFKGESEAGESSWLSASE